MDGRINLTLIVTKGEKMYKIYRYEEKTRKIDVITQALPDDRSEQVQADRSEAKEPDPPEP